MPRIGVLALQGDFREHAQSLKDAGAISVSFVKTPQDLQTIDALVIPGGESTAMSKLAIAFEILEPIRKRISQGIPVYGSCAGLIMLAAKVIDGRADQETFGGLDISVRRNAFGRQVDSFEADLHAPEIGSEGVRAVFIRAPWVEDFNEKVEVIARIESGEHKGAVVAVKQGNIMATSFHPELTSDLRFHKYFINLVNKYQTLERL
jgi:5'-phosphate synthase pdxT subunit